MKDWKFDKLSFVIGAFAGALLFGIIGSALSSRV